jgi:hypothetical protein
LPIAFHGTDKLLLIPSADFGRRCPQARKAIDAATSAGVATIAYAGFVYAVVPAGFADIVADTSFAISRGDWYIESADLETLIQRRPTQLSDIVASAFPR